MLVRQRNTVAEVFVDGIIVTRHNQTVLNIPIFNVLCCGLSPSGNLLATASAHHEPKQSVLMAHQQNGGIRVHILVPWLVLKIAINNSGSCFALVIKMEDNMDELVVAYSTQRHKILTIYAGADQSIQKLRFVTENCLNVDKSIVFVDLH